MMPLVEKCVGMLLDTSIPPILIIICINFQNLDVDVACPGSVSLAQQSSQQLQLAQQQQQLRQLCQMAEMLLRAEQGPAAATATATAVTTQSRVDTGIITIEPF